MITMLGLLYATISNIPIEVFVPHLALGLIVWSLITSLINAGTKIILGNKPKLLLGVSLNDILMVHIFTSFLKFMHVLLISIGVWFLYKWQVTPYALLSIIGIFLILLNGYWFSIVFGILSTRFQDIPELMTALLGAMFFLTPIIWMPGYSGRLDILGPYLTFNPLYHFMELVRAPILGNVINPISPIVVICITIFGFLLAALFYRRFSDHLVIWL